MKILARISSEVMLKSNKVRMNFQRRLVHNIKKAFEEEKVEHTITISWGMFFIKTENENATEILKRIFGIASLSYIDLECSSSFEEICEHGNKFYQKKVKDKTFALQTKREGKHDFNSNKINIQLGSLLSECGGKVNLSNPEVGIKIKVGPRTTYMYSNKIKGSGGLPLNCGGRALCLISGGFDSAAAAWLTQKRGVQVDYLFCNLAGKAYEYSVLKVINKIAKDWSYGYNPRIYSVNFQKLLLTLQKKINPSYSQVVLKRLFYKAAEEISKTTGADVIITGEALGQVSSQTLSNLKAIEANTKIPVLRPLISFDKEDIIELCRHIGTYEISKTIREVCKISDAKPVTTCLIEDLDKQEHAIPPELFEEMMKRKSSFKATNIDESDLLASYIFVEEVNEDAVILDCRTKTEYDKKHIPQAIHTPSYLFEKTKNFDKQKSYIIYCEYGIQSSLIAEKMQTQGFEAYCLRGGLKQYL